MKAKNIFKTLAFAMLMPAMMLTTACSSDNDVITNNENINKKGYEIPVTLNATRQGDDATTRATYNPDTRKLEYSTGDQLYVVGNHATAGMYGGALEWKGGIIFGGTITTTNPYEGSGVELLSSSIWSRAMLLPAGYNNYHYITINNPGFSCSLGATFATSKATAIEQFSNETVKGYNNGFALAPQNAILNFTLTGLTPNTEITVKLWNSYYSLIQGNVTTNGSGTATFAIGIDISSCKAPATTVDIHDLYNTGWELRVNDELMPPLVTSSTPLEPGHIYNISRSVAPAVPDGAISAVFSVSATKKVYFSKGNLQYIGSATTPYWKFAEHQYDYLGTTTGQNSDATNVDRDLFGWGTSGSAPSGQTARAPYYTSWPYDDGYVSNMTTAGESWGTTSEWDWGHNAISNGGNTAGTWRTLTGGSGGEWEYLFNTRSASTVNGTANARYAKAKVCDVQGVILFPDIYTHPSGVTAPVGINATDATGWNGNTYDATAWSKMETAGCAFLPAAGLWPGTKVDRAGSACLYWSSTASGTTGAYSVYFYSDGVDPKEINGRSLGQSVRLVRDVPAGSQGTQANDRSYGDQSDLGTW